MQKVTEQDGQSANIVDENIEQMKVLFPDAFTEGGVDFDVLRQLLGDASALDEGEEKYGLNWHGKKQARQIALTPSAGTLLPCPKESVDWDTTQNLFIEGDNLEVLKLLQKSYAGKIKMIYIDPPYNTGKDFVYPDNYQDNLETYLRYTGQKNGDGIKISSNTESGGRLHTSWLNMMLPRLRLAKTLLKKEGLICISIDDNEQANLRMLLDDVFGSENFVACLPTVMNLKGNHDNFGFSDTHEYTLVYAKRRDFAELAEFVLDGEEADDWVEDDFGQFKRADTLRRTGQDAARERRPKGWFPVFISQIDQSIYVTDNNEPRSADDYVLWPINDDDEELSWSWGKPKITAEPHNLLVVEGRKGKNIYKKQRPALGDLPTKKPKTIWYKPEYSTSTATTELKKLMGAKVFEGPKPVPFVQDLIKICAGRDGIVVDFFAGSGTLAHAAMLENAQHDKSIRTISVQLPEKTSDESGAGKLGFKSITEIGRSRIASAAVAIKATYPKAKFDGGYRTYRLASSNINAWNPDRTDLEATLLSHKDHLVEGRTEQDVLYELLLKRGIELTVPIEEKKIAGKTIYSIGYGVLFACLDTSIAKGDVDAVAAAIAEWHKELEPETDSHVFFRDSAFADDIAKTNMAAILEQNGIAHVRSL